MAGSKFVIVKFIHKKTSKCLWKKMRVSWMLSRLAIFLMHLLFVRSHGEEQSIFLLLLLIHALSLLIAITTDAAHQSVRDQHSAAARGGINTHRCSLDSAKVTRTRLFELFTSNRLSCLRETSARGISSPGLFVNGTTEGRRRSRDQEV